MLLLSTLTGLGDEIAAPWSLASEQTGLSKDKENSLPVDLRIKFGEVDEDLKLWVYFTDKGVFEENTYRAAAMSMVADSNSRTLQRRSFRRSSPGLVDGYDLPLKDSYIESVDATGARIEQSTRWLNAVSVRASLKQAEKIIQLPWVRAIREVRMSRRDDLSSPQVVDLNPGKSERDRSFYGNSQIQLDQINLPALHARGFTGEGVIIGVLDSGFRRDHVAFNHPDGPIQVVAEWDFVNDDPDTGVEYGDDTDQHFHGTAILGALAPYMPMELVGAAYDAAYVLAKVEDAASEFPLEEDWFAAGLEFLEAEGCDVATSSLIAYWYEQDDMDGETSVMAQVFNIATSNGLHCCQAVGNSGHDSDPAKSHLTTPADAFDVIACGAIDIYSQIAGFSSDGPTLDGRVKPEVLARGSAAWTVDAYSQTSYVTVSGTSISAPQVAGAVACLVQAHPDWDVGMMRDRLFQTSDYYLAHGETDPLFVQGYGIIDVIAAEDTPVGLSDAENEWHRLRASPNPFSDRTFISASLLSSGILSVDVYDIRGRRVRRQEFGFRDVGSQVLPLTGEGLPNGVYLYRLRLDDRELGSGKLLIVR